MVKEVICKDDSVESHLTLWNKYQVIEEDKDNYKIRNDEGNDWWYDKAMFE